MFNFIRTILSVLFFALVFGAVLIKNKAREFEIVLEQSIDYPLINHFDYLQSTAAEKWIKTSLSEIEYLFPSPQKQGYTGLQKNQYELEFRYAGHSDFTLKEQWIFSPDTKLVRLKFSYSLGFRERLLLLPHPHFNDSLRSIAIQRVEKTRKNVALAYQKHRWQYQGTTTLPLTYYLALEGESDWNALEEDTARAFEQILDFAKGKNIPTRPNSFIVYPRISDSIVRWRAAISVDRFYSTNRSDIRCRRYKGGKALQLTHLGTNDYLKGSWSILQDSTVNEIQTYPAIQAINLKKDSILDPLKWTTQLFIPIQ